MILFTDFKFQDGFLICTLNKKVSFPNMLHNTGDKIKNTTDVLYIKAPTLGTNKGHLAIIDKALLEAKQSLSLLPQVEQMENNEDKDLLQILDGMNIDLYKEEGQIKFVRTQLLSWNEKIPEAMYKVMDAVYKIIENNVYTDEMILINPSNIDPMRFNEDNSDHAEIIAELQGICTLEYLAVFISFSRVLRMEIGKMLQSIRLIKEMKKSGQQK